MQTIRIIASVSILESWAIKATLCCNAGVAKRQHSKQKKNTSLVKELKQK